MNVSPVQINVKQMNRAETLLLKGKGLLAKLLPSFPRLEVSGVS